MKLASAKTTQENKEKLMNEKQRTKDNGVEQIKKTNKKLMKEGKKEKIRSFFLFYNLIIKIAE